MSRMNHVTRRSRAIPKQREQHKQNHRGLNLHLYVINMDIWITTGSLSEQLFKMTLNLTQSHLLSLIHI